MSTEYMHGCCKNATARTQDVPLAQRERHYLSLYRVDENGCWLFQGHVNRATGYGTVSNKYAHRYFYEAHVGPIPHGLVIDHLCRVRSCVNPAHLEPVTQAENVRRAEGHVSTLRAAETHCRYGHEYTPQNTRTVRGRNGRTTRRCYTCQRARYYRTLGREVPLG